MDLISWFIDYFIKSLMFCDFILVCFLTLFMILSMIYKDDEKIKETKSKLATSALLVSVIMVIIVYLVKGD